MYAKTARENDVKRTVEIQEIWDEIRKYVLDYTIKLRLGQTRLPDNRIFSVNYNERPIARFEY